MKLGDNQHKRVGQNALPKTQQEIANELGICIDELKRILVLERKLTPDIKELLDEGLITKTSALKIWSKNFRGVLLDAPNLFQSINMSRGQATLPFYRHDRVYCIFCMLLEFFQQSPF